MQQVQGDSYPSSFVITKFNILSIVIHKDMIFLLQAENFASFSVKMNTVKPRLSTRHGISSLMVNRGPKKDE